MYQKNPSNSIQNTYKIPIFNVYKKVYTKYINIQVDTYQSIKYISHICIDCITLCSMALQFIHTYINANITWYNLIIYFKYMVFKKYTHNN